MVHEFSGGDIGLLAREVSKYYSVRVNFQFLPNQDHLQSLASRVGVYIRRSLKDDVGEVHFYQMDKPGRRYPSYVFTIAAPKTNIEAKKLLYESFM